MAIWTEGEECGIPPDGIVLIQEGTGYTVRGFTGIGEGTDFEGRVIVQAFEGDQEIGVFALPPGDVIQVAPPE